MTQEIKIKACSYDHALLDNSISAIVETVSRGGGTVSGPIPLPTKREIITILRAVHKYKDSREQFERRTHKRLLYIKNPNAKIVDLLKRLNLPAGVYVEIEIDNS